jgi:hypothetical protein
VFRTSDGRRSGASDWFVRSSPEKPWGGFVKIHQWFDGEDDAALRDIWRAAHFVGRPVAIPAMPPPTPAAATPAVTLRLAGGGLDGRSEFVRGEAIAVDVHASASIGADRLRLVLTEADDHSVGRSPARPLLTVEQPLVGDAAHSEVETGTLADRSYLLEAQVIARGTVVGSTESKIGVRESVPSAFDLEVLHQPSSNDLRANLEFRDIAEANADIYSAVDVRTIDLAIRNHRGFSLRAIPQLPRASEAPRIGPDDRPLMAPDRSGRFAPAIDRMDFIERTRRLIHDSVQSVAQIPAFRPYVLTNDDFSQYYGWDYAPEMRAAFRAATGRDPPRRMQKPAQFGAVADDDPWVQWFRWTLANVDGALNRAEVEGATDARADVRVGPIPGVAMAPLIQMREPSQYPSYAFGAGGFNLISYYYYDFYWQPSLGYTYWTEVARMDHRDLPVWVMPELLTTAGSIRNAMFHALAGGARGLAYFRYADRTPATWREFRRLGSMIARVGAVQAALAPAQRDVALLLSFTANCFEPDVAIWQMYSYANILQAHLGLDVVSEDEVAADRASAYKAVIVTGVDFLGASAFNALVRYARAGGLVLVDRSVPFDLPGAHRLALDLRTGLASQGNPTPVDYGHPDRIDAVRHALDKYVAPGFESADTRLAAFPMGAAGARYTWFVNTLGPDEYAFERAHMADIGLRASALAEVRTWEEALLSRGPYVTQVTYTDADGVPYDLVRGGEVPVTLKDGRRTLQLSMDPWGGALVVWLPSRIGGLSLEAPDVVAPGEHVEFHATLSFGGARAVGALPVEFTLKDPTGRPWAGSRVVVAEGGRATLVWTPARNDPPGRWTLQARELAGGHRKAVQIRLSSSRK